MDLFGTYISSTTGMATFSYWTIGEYRHCSEQMGNLYYRQKRGGMQGENPGERTDDCKSLPGDRRAGG
jgi:hypothetical protein